MKRFAMFVAIALIVVSTTAILYFRHQGRPQNVLLITLDGLRRDHVSYFGYEKETTPNIDALARQGFAFGNVIPTGCETPHSLGSLFTSIGYRYHHISDQVHHQLPSEFYTLAEAFFDQGYITSGVTANPVITKSKNFDQGFMIYEDFSDTIDDLLSFKKLARAEVVGQTCLDFLERYGAGDRQHPFFLYAHFFEPHPPWFYEYSDGELKEIEETFPLERGCFYLPKDERYRSAADSLQKENIISMYDGAVY